MFWVLDKKAVRVMRTVSVALCMFVTVLAMKNDSCAVQAQPVQSYEWGLHFEKEKSLRHTPRNY